MNVIEVYGEYEKALENSVTSNLKSIFEELLTLSSQISKKEYAFAISTPQTPFFMNFDVINPKVREITYGFFSAPYGNLAISSKFYLSIVQINKILNQNFKWIRIAPNFNIYPEEKEICFSFKVDVKILEKYEQSSTIVELKNSINKFSKFITKAIPSCKISYTENLDFTMDEFLFTTLIKNGFYIDIYIPIRNNTLNLENRC